ncbi:MAG: prepilin peptidase [Planctomycetota bacterium]|jgi:leader peptidase (prepilin peptidase)/N-methyltransferase
MPGNILYPAVLFFFGLCVGSFLNVVIYRLPRYISVIQPSSKCPGCGRSLTAFENIPVLSWLIQLGKCRGCKSPIHWRYPAVEFFTGIMWALTGYFFHNMDGDQIVRVTGMLLNLWFITWLIAISFIDIDLTIIPDELNFSGIIIAMLASTFFIPLHPETTLWFPAASPYLSGFLAGTVGLAVGAGCMYLISLAGTIAFKAKITEIQEEEDPEVDSAIGFGDVKLMAFLGAFLGWKEVLIAFFFSTLAGSFVGIIQKIRTGKDAEATNDDSVFSKTFRNFISRWQTGESLIPYGPFLCIGSVIVLYYRTDLLIFCEKIFSLQVQ